MKKRVLGVVDAHRVWTAAILIVVGAIVAIALVPTNSADDGSEGANTTVTNQAPAVKTTTESKQLNVIYVDDLDGNRCASTETKYGRCPSSKYFGMKPAAARAKKRAEARAAREAARRARERAAAAERQANAWKRGYYEYSDGIAIKWDNSVCDASYYSCFGMRVITRDGCANLYVELQIQDAAGNAVGYTNDTASGLTAGQEAHLDFPNLEESGETARISEITCF